uniref:Mucosa-associated lymphoid tissue lymphoma translocation protein 1 n=1 Tax=Calidris pygmaea TaxID=425635 RepID=A0A8C3JV76_9CHAR
MSLGAVAPGREVVCKCGGEGNRGEGVRTPVGTWTKTPVERGRAWLWGWGEGTCRLGGEDTRAEGARRAVERGRGTLWGGGKDTRGDGSEVTLAQGRHGPLGTRARGASRRAPVGAGRAVPGRAVPCRTVPCRAVPCRAVPGRTVPCCTGPCRAVPCRAGAAPAPSGTAPRGCAVGAGRGGPGGAEVRGWRGFPRAAGQCGAARGSGPAPRGGEPAEASARRPAARPSPPQRPPVGRVPTALQLRALPSRLPQVLLPLLRERSHRGPGRRSDAGSHRHHRAAGVRLRPCGILLHPAVQGRGTHPAAVPVVLSAPGLPPWLWRGEPVIVLNPTEQRVEVGKPLQLQCAAMGVPAPTYQWYRNGNLLEQQKKKKLWITHAKVSDSGTYLCCASNSHGEHWTNAVDVHIGTHRSEKFFATGKIALLVGNNHYQHHPNLMAPVTDVFELSLLLEQLGFQVVSLLDLNKAEMVTAVSRFLQLLEKGVYAVFYYAGHGYEHLGRNYMVPVDAPQPYAPENCISVQRILQKMQQQQTALNLILLDTCRKWYNPECALSQVQPLEPWGNTIYGYATSEDAEAYELQDGEFSSGIFMKYLKKHILQEKKVTHMLEDVLEDIGRDPLVTGKQVMEIKHTLKEARSLTDPICPLGAAAKHWGRSHEPLSKIVSFPCGVQVELCFHRVFSNLMYVCAKLQPPPAHVTDARLLLCRPTVSPPAEMPVPFPSIPTGLLPLGQRGRGLW